MVFLDACLQERKFLRVSVLSYRAYIHRCPEKACIAWFGDAQFNVSVLIAQERTVHDWNHKVVLQHFCKN